MVLVVFVAVGDLHCGEEGGCSDGSDWTQAAYLLDDFGQNCSCMI